MDCSCNSYVNVCYYLIIIIFFFLSFFCRFFKQWTLPYFTSYHEQTCFFEFSSLAIILEHYLCFINTVLLLTIDPLLLFMSLLLSLIPSFLFSSSFSHNLLSSFPFTISSSQNLITPSPFKPSATSLTKGDSSSYRKGKEVAANNLPTKTAGEEAPYSESNRFEEEEGGRDPSSQMLPIDKNAFGYAIVRWTSYFEYLLLCNYNNDRSICLQNLLNINPYV